MKTFRSAVVWAGVLATASSGAAMASGARTAAPSGQDYAQQYQYPSRDQYPDRDDARPRISDAQLRQLVNRIRTDAQTMRNAAPSATSGAYGSRPRGDNDLIYALDDLRQAADRLLERAQRQQVQRSDVDELLRRGASVDTVMRQSPRNINGWVRLERDFSDLAGAYGIADWRDDTYGAGAYSQGSYGYDRGSSAGVYQSLTGTYRLDPGRSDDPRRAADEVLRQLPAAQRDQVSQRLFARLDPPDVLAISRNAMHVTIASSRAPQLTFDADGRVRTEEGMNGRRMTTQATLYGDRLEVSTKGAQGNDFSVTFEPLNNGQQLRVTRRLFDDRLRQPVTVRSVYERTSDAPDWDIYAAEGANRAYRESAPGGYPNAPVPVPQSVFTSDMRMTATLDQPIVMRNVRQNDRVTLTVRDAGRSDFDGATIEGSILAVPSGANNGRAGLSLAFDQIRLRSGRTMPFDGVIESVRGPNGEQIAYNGETVQPGGDRTQTEQAVQRGAIGAALGAVLGAIAGGGKGAAVGAVLGGGGGAATVFVDSLNFTELPRGTEFTIRGRAERR